MKTIIDLIFCWFTVQSAYQQFVQWACVRTQKCQLLCFSPLNHSALLSPPLHSYSVIVGNHNKSHYTTNGVMKVSAHLPALSFHYPSLYSNLQSFPSALHKFCFGYQHLAIRLDTVQNGDNILIFSIHGMPNLDYPWNKHMTYKCCNESVFPPTTDSSMAKDY